MPWSSKVCEQAMASVESPLPIFFPYPYPYPSVYNLYALYHKRSLMARAFLFLSD